MDFNLKTLRKAGLLSTLLLLTHYSQASNIDIYGTINLSADRVTSVANNESVEDLTIASNSSNLGFKGKTELGYNLTAVWQLENGIDVSGETGSISARNRFLGLSHQYGRLLMGIYDTPYKTLAKKMDIMPWSIADRRTMLGVSVLGPTSIDLRARNSVIYISPSFYGFEARLMQTTGNDTNKAGDSNSVTSTSLLYDNDSLYAGVSYEIQNGVNTDSTTGRPIDTTGIRIAGGYHSTSLSLNAIYEILQSDTNPEFDRPAYGGSISYKISDTTFKAQGFLVGDYQDQPDSNASLFAFGVSQNMDKNTEIYILYAFNNNAARSRTALGGPAHGETYTPDFGENMQSSSLGIIYRF